MNLRLGPASMTRSWTRPLQILCPGIRNCGQHVPVTDLYGIKQPFYRFPMEPQLVHELLEKMRSANAVVILVSFIKWSGLRLLMPGFEDLRDRKVPVRIITISCMGASDTLVIEWLAHHLPNVQIRVSYDTRRTRLHANASHFCRKSGLSTNYFGFGFFYILLDYKQVIILLKC